jgi:hypothetical protein
VHQCRSLHMEISAVGFYIVLTGTRLHSSETSFRRAYVVRGVAVLFR